MVITQKIFSMELDWNGWIKHVPRFGMVVYNASRWSLGLCAGSELCSRNCAGLSPLPAVLTASHCIPCSLLLPGHCVPGCCENTALPTLSGDLSWGCEVGQGFTKDPGWQESVQKRSLFTGGWTWKFQNLNGKGPSTGIGLLLTVLQGRLASSHGVLWPHSLTLSLDPTTFSRFQQEKTRTLSPSHPKQYPRIHNFFGCFFGQYVEFQLLYYFAYSTNFTSNILPN